MMDFRQEADGRDVASEGRKLEKKNKQGAAKKRALENERMP